MRKYPINRSDKVYLEIENFEDYELTNCIAYEMAIRNDEVIHLSNMIMQHDEVNPNVELMCQKLEELYLLEKNCQVYLLFQKQPPLKHMIKGYIKHAPKIENLLNYENIDGEIIFNYKKETSFNEKKFPYFKRPKLKSPSYIQQNINLKINLALPKEELIAYISKIKESYEIDRYTIKIPIELLREDLEKADNEISITRPKGRQEHINIRKHINKQEKYADMFFIYDAYKKSMKQKDIIQSINDYYYDTKNKETYFDAKTVTKYREIAKEYIDNLKYKELITGIKEK